MGLSSLFPPCGFQALNSGPYFGTKCIYLLSHLAGQEKEFIGRMWTFAEASAIVV